MRRRKVWSVAALVVVLLILAWTMLPTFKMTPPSPALRGFGGQKQWVLSEPMTWQIGDTDLSITVPRGFVTDLASIPPILAPLGLTPTGQYGRAAIVHDYLYWTQACSRNQSDRLMLKAMQESAVDPSVISQIHAGVSTLGQSAWATNARERASGGFRVLPPGLDRPADPNLDWPQYRSSLAGRNVKDPAMSVNPAVCRYADGIAVPATPPDDPTTRMPGG